ncbi:MAG: YdcF family protein [Elusimicrobia bacterium]|nr:YdcF family protein [Elusimicrobiota bacterium]
MSEGRERVGVDGTIPESLAWTRFLPQVRAFYELALERDLALVKNALADMERTGVQRGVLIAGGFHTPGLTRLLRQSGASYAVVQPSFEMESRRSSDELTISQAPDAFSQSAREANLAVFNPAAPLGQSLTGRMEIEFSLQAIVDYVLSGSEVDREKNLSLLKENKARIEVLGVPLTFDRVMSFIDENGVPYVAGFGQYGGEPFVVAVSLDATRTTQWMRVDNLNQKDAVSLNKKLGGLLEARGLGAAWASFIKSFKALAAARGGTEGGLSDLRAEAMQAMAALPLDQIGKLLVDFVHSSETPIIPQSKTGEETVHKAIEAVRISAEQAPSKVKLFFQNFLTWGSIVSGSVLSVAAFSANAATGVAGVGLWSALVTQLSTFSQLFDLTNIVGSLSSYSPALGASFGAFPVVLVVLAFTGVILWSSIKRQPVAVLPSGGNNTPPTIPAPSMIPPTPVPIQPSGALVAEEVDLSPKNLLPLLAGGVVAAVFFLWLLPFSISFLTTALPASLSGILAPVFLILNVSAGVGFYMVALTVGWKVARSKEYQGTRTWEIFRVVAPIAMFVFTSGVLSGLILPVAVWSVATSSLARKGETLGPIVKMFESQIEGVRSLSANWFNTLHSGTSPPKNAVIRSTLWVGTKAAHGMVDLWGTFKGFAFQSALDLYAIYEGKSAKSENQLTTAERGYRSALTALRGESTVGSVRYAIAQALGLPGLVLFYTIATVNRRLALLILSSVATYTGTQLISGFVWVALLGNGVGALFMASFFFMQAWRFYQKFRDEREEGKILKGVNARAVLFTIFGFTALAVGVPAILGGVDLPIFLGNILAFNPLDSIPGLNFDSHELASLAQANPHDHGLQIKHAFVQLLSPTAWVGSIMLALLMTIKGFARNDQIKKADEKGQVLGIMSRTLGWLFYVIPTTKLLWNGSLESRRAFLKGVKSSAIGLQTVNPEVALVVGGAAYMEGLGVGLDPVAAVVRKIEDTQELSIMGLSTQLTESLSEALFGQAGMINLHEYGVVGTDRTNNELIEMAILRNRIEQVQGQVEAQKNQLTQSGNLNQKGVEDAQRMLAHLQEKMEELNAPRVTAPPPAQPAEGAFRGLLPMIMNLIVPDAAAKAMDRSLAPVQSLDEKSEEPSTSPTTSVEPPIEIPGIVMTNSSNLNLREEPNAKSAFLASLPRLGKVQVQLDSFRPDAVPGWYHIRAVSTDGQELEGYVAARYIQLEKSSVEPTEEEVPSEPVLERSVAPEQSATSRLVAQMVRRLKDYRGEPPPAVREEGPMDASGRPTTVGGHRITGRFGDIRLNKNTDKEYPHEGVDLGVEKETKLWAFDGLHFLRALKDKRGGTGVDVGYKGQTFRFWHLDPNGPHTNFKPGDPIPQGTVFAKTGNSGNATGPTVHIEHIGSDGVKSDPLKSPLLAGFFGQGDSPAEGSGSERQIVQFGGALATIDRVTAVQVANLKVRSAALYASEILAKRFTGDIEFAVSRAKINKTDPGVTKEILDLIYRGNAGNEAHLLKGQITEPDQTTQKSTMELQVSLLIKAITGSDLTRESNVREAATKVRESLAEIETKVTAPRILLDLFHDIRSVDQQLLNVKAELERLENQKKEIETRISTSRENRRLRDQYKMQKDVLTNTIKALEREREDAIVKLFNFHPGAWPEGTTLAEAKKSSFQIDPTQAEIDLRNAGFEEGAELNIRLAWEKAAVLKAAIPAHLNMDAEINVALTFLRALASHASGGLSLAIDAVGRMALYDPERESLQQAGVWAYARAVVEAENVARMERHKLNLSVQERDHLERMVDSQQTSYARGERERMELEQKLKDGEIAYRDYLEKAKSLRETYQVLERTRRELDRQKTNVAIQGLGETALPRPDSEATFMDRVKNAFGSGGFFALFQDPDAAAKKQIERMDAEKERRFVPVNLVDPAFLPSARVLMDRDPGIWSARMGVEEAKAEREANRNSGFRLNVYGRVGGASDGNSGSGSLSLGLGGSMKWDAAEDLKDMILQRKEENKRLAESELTGRALISLATLQEDLNYLLGIREELDKKIEVLHDIINENEGAESVNQQDRLVRLGRARLELDDAIRDRLSNENRINAAKKDLGRLLNLTEKDQLVFTDSFKARSVWTSIPYLNYEPLIDRTGEGAASVDVLNAAGRKLLEKTQGEIGTVMDHVTTLRARLPLLQAIKAEEVFTMRGNNEKINQVKVVRETLENEFSEGNIPNDDVVATAVRQLSALTQGEAIPPLPDATLLESFDVYLKDFAQIRERAAANAIKSPEKVYEDLRDLSKGALRLLVIKASLSPALKWGSLAGMAMDRQVADWDINFRPLYDSSHASQRIALNTAEIHHGEATKTSKTEPVIANIDFFSLFSTGVGNGVGASLFPLNNPLGIINIPQKKWEELFDWSYAGITESLKNDPDGSGKILSQLVPGYQSRLLRNSEFSRNMQQAALELITARQRAVDSQNFQDSFITQLQLSRDIHKLIKVKVDALERGAPGQKGLRLETNLRIAGGEAKLIEAQKELEEYEKRIIVLGIVLLGQQIDPNNLPPVDEGGTSAERVTLSYASEAGKRAVETQLGELRKNIKEEEAKTMALMKGMPRMPVTVGFTGDENGRGAFFSFRLYSPKDAVLSSQVEAAINYASAADLAIMEIRHTQTSRLNGDIQTYIGGLVRQEVSKAMANLVAERNTHLVNAAYGGQEQNNANVVAYFQFLKGIEQGGSAKNDARYKVQTALGQTGLVLNFALPSPDDLVPDDIIPLSRSARRASAIALQRLPLNDWADSPGFGAFFSAGVDKGNKGRHPEQARLAAKQAELRSEEIRNLLPTIDLTVFTTPINGKTLTLSARWSLFGGGSEERQEINKTEQEEINVYLEEKLRLHQSFLKHEKDGLRDSLEIIRNINRELQELTENFRAQNLQRDFTSERIQMGDLIAYQNRLTTLVSQRTYEYWMVALKYQNIADILETYGEKIPPLDETLTKAGFPILPEGTRTLYDELMRGPFNEDEKPAQIVKEPTTKWKEAQVRAKTPIEKPTQIENNPPPIVSRVLNVFGERVDIPLTHLPFRGPDWFLKDTSLLADGIGVNLADNRLLNDTDFAVFFDRILDIYGIPQTPGFMSNLKLTSRVVFNKFHDLTDASEMPNSLSKFTEDAFKTIFPFHGLVTAGKEVSSDMDKNFHKKMALAIYLAREMTLNPKKYGGAWLTRHIDEINEHIRLSVRERKGERLSSPDKEKLFAWKKDISAAMDRTFFWLAFSEGKGKAHASKVDAAYRREAKAGMERLVPELVRWQERIKNTDAADTTLSLYGNLDEESLYSSLSAIALANGWNPGALRDILYFLGDTITPQVARYARGATIQDYAQQPDADLLRALLQDYFNPPGVMSPLEKAIREDKIRYVAETERAKFLIATSLIWMAEYFKAMGVDPAKGIKDPALKDRIATDFTQTMDRMLALRNMPEIQDIIKRQGAAVEGRIYWYSTEVLGILTAFGIDWVREKWTLEDARAHASHIIYAVDFLLPEITQYYEAQGRPSPVVDLKSKDPIKRSAAWAELSALVGSLEKLHRDPQIDKDEMRQTLLDLTAVEKGFQTGQKRLMEKVNHLRKQAEAPGAAREALLKEALRYEREVQEFRLSVGQAGYLFRLTRGLILEEAELMPVGERDKALQDLVVNTMLAKTRFLEAGQRVADRLRHYLAEPETRPAWLTVARIEQMIVFVSKEGSVPGLRDLEVSLSAAVSYAAKYMPGRSYGTKDVMIEAENEILLQAVHMSSHQDERGLPERLPRGELAPYLDSSRAGIHSLDQNARILFFDGVADNAIKTLPARVVANLGIKPGDSNYATTLERVRGSLFELSETQNIGLATRLMWLQDHGAIGSSAEAVDAYLEDWIKDAAFLQAELWKASQGTWVLPYLLLNSAMEAFRDREMSMNETGKENFIKRLTTRFTVDLGLRDLHEHNTLRSLLTSHYIVFGEVPTLVEEKAWMDRWRELGSRMAGEPKQKVLAAQYELLVRAKILRESFTRLVAQDVYRQGKLDTDRLEKARLDAEERVMPVLINSIVNKEARQKEVYEISTRTEYLRDIQRPLRERAELLRQERQEGNRAMLEDKAATNRIGADLARRYPLESSVWSFFKGLMWDGYSPSEIELRFLSIPKRVETLYEEITGEKLDVEDERQKGLVSALADNIFLSWGFLFAEGNEVLRADAEQTLAAAHARDPEVPGSVVEAYEKAFSRLRDQLKLSVAARENIETYGQVFNASNPIRNAARRQSESLRIGGDALAGAVHAPDLNDLYATANLLRGRALALRSDQDLDARDRRLLAGLPVGTVPDVNADSNMDARALYEADLVLRMGVVELVDTTQLDPKRLGVEFGPETTPVELEGRIQKKLEEAVHRELSWMFTQKPRQTKAQKMIPEAILERIPESILWLIEAPSLELTLQKKIAADPEFKQAALVRVAKHLRERGIEPVELVLLLEEVKALQALIADVQTEEEAKAMFDVPAGAVYGLTDLTLLIMLDENRPKPIGLLSILFPEMDPTNPENTATDGGQAAGKEGLRFLRKTGQPLSASAREKINERLEEVVEAPIKLRLHRFLLGEMEGTWFANVSTFRNIPLAAVLTVFLLFLLSWPLMAIGRLIDKAAPRLSRVRIVWPLIGLVQWVWEFFTKTFNIEELHHVRDEFRHQLKKLNLDIRTWSPHILYRYKLPIFSFLGAFYALFFVFWNVAVLAPYASTFSIPAAFIFFLFTAKALQIFPKLTISLSFAYQKAFLILVGETLLGIGVWDLFAGSNILIDLLVTVFTFLNANWVFWPILGLHALLMVLTSNWMIRAAGEDPGYIIDQEVFDEVAAALPERDPTVPLAVNVNRLDPIRFVRIGHTEDEAHQLLLDRLMTLEISKEQAERILEELSKGHFQNMKDLETRVGEITSPYRDQIVFNQGEIPSSAQPVNVLTHLGEGEFDMVVSPWLPEMDLPDTFLEYFRTEIAEKMAFTLRGNNDRKQIVSMHINGPMLAIFDALANDAHEISRNFGMNFDSVYDHLLTMTDNPSEAAAYLDSQFISGGFRLALLAVIARRNIKKLDVAMDNLHQKLNDIRQLLPERADSEAEAFRFIVNPGRSLGSEYSGDDYQGLRDYLRTHYWEAAEKGKFNSISFEFGFPHTVSNGRRVNSTPGRMIRAISEISADYAEEFDYFDESNVFHPGTERFVFFVGAGNRPPTLQAMANRALVWGENGTPGRFWGQKEYEKKIADGEDPENFKSQVIDMGGRRVRVGLPHLTGGENGENERAIAESRAEMEGVLIRYGVSRDIIPNLASQMVKEPGNAVAIVVDTFLKLTVSDAAQRTRLVRDFLKQWNKPNNKGRRVLEREKVWPLDLIAEIEEIASRVEFDMTPAFMRSKFFYGAVIPGQGFVGWDEAIGASGPLSHLPPTSPGNPRVSGEIKIDNGNFTTPQSLLYLSKVAYKYKNSFGLFQGKSGSYFPFEGARAPTIWGALGDLAQQHQLWFTQVGWAKLLDYTRSGGKYNGLASIIDERFGPKPGFPYGFYHTMGWVYSGIVIHWMQDFEKLVPSQGAFNSGLSGKFVMGGFNSEDERMSAIMEDVLQLWTWVAGGRKGRAPMNPAMIDVLKPLLDQMEKFSLPPSKNLSTGLVERPDRKALIGDDRPATYAFEWWRLTKKWLTTFDYVQAWLKHKGRSVAQGLRGGTLNDLVDNGLMAEVTFLFLLVQGFIYTALISGAIEVSLAKAAWVLTSTIYALIVHTKVTGPVLQMIETRRTLWGSVAYAPVAILKGVVIFVPLAAIEIAISTGVYVGMLIPKVKAVLWDGILFVLRFRKYTSGGGWVINWRDIHTQPLGEYIRMNALGFSFAAGLVGVIYIMGDLLGWGPQAIFFGSFILGTLITVVSLSQADFWAFLQKGLMGPINNQKKIDNDWKDKAQEGDLAAFVARRTASWAKLELVVQILTYIVLPIAGLTLLGWAEGAFALHEAIPRDWLFLGSTVVLAMLAMPFASFLSGIQFRSDKAQKSILPILWVLGVLLLVATGLVHAPSLQPIFGPYIEAMAKVPMAVASGVLGADSVVGLYAPLLGVEAPHVAFNTLLLLGMMLSILLGFIAWGIRILVLVYRRLFQQQKTPIPFLGQRIARWFTIGIIAGVIAFFSGGVKGIVGGSETLNFSPPSTISIPARLSLPEPMGTLVPPGAGDLDLHPQKETPPLSSPAGPSGALDAPKIPGALSLGLIPFAGVVGKRRSSLKKQEAKVITRARQELIAVAQPYFDLLAKESSAADGKTPNVFLLLGNPDARVFVEFAERWKKDFVGIPLVLSGGRGPGVVPLLNGIKDIAKLSEGELLIDIRRVVGGEGDLTTLAEAELIQYILVRQGVPADMIRGVDVESKNTSENFENTKTSIQGILSSEEQARIAVVTGPALMFRAQREARKVWGDAVGVVRPYDLQLEELEDGELIALVSVRAGNTASFIAAHPKLNIGNEVTRVKRVVEEGEDAAQIEELERVRSLIEGPLDRFLQQRGVTYDEAMNRLVPTPVEGGSKMIRSFVLPLLIVGGLVAMSLSGNLMAAELISSSNRLLSLNDIMLGLLGISVLSVSFPRVRVILGRWFQGMGVRFMDVAEKGIGLGAWGVNKILRTPQLLVALVMGVVGIAGAAGFLGAGFLGSVGLGASGVANSAGVPVLLAMVMVAVPLSVGSGLSSLRGKINTPVIKVFNNVRFQLQLSPGAFTSGVSRIAWDRISNIIDVDGKSEPVGPETLSNLSRVQGEIPRREDPSIVAVLPNGNLGINEWFVGFAEGTFFHKKDEKWQGRVYDMLVQPRQGSPRVQALRFESKNGAWRVLDARTNNDVTGEIGFAVYGQRIVKDGKNNVSNLAEEFEDLRHLFSFPLFPLSQGRQLHLGFNDDLGELVKDQKKREAALRGEPVKLSLEPLRTHNISDEVRDRTFGEWGYTRRESGTRTATMKAGDYWVSADGNSMTVRFLPGINPHSFIGFQKDGRVMVGLVPGRTREEGASLVDLSDQLIAQGAKDVFLYANGKDAVINQAEFNVGAENARMNTMSALVLASVTTAPPAMPGSGLGQSLSDLRNFLLNSLMGFGFLSVPGAQATGNALVVDMRKELGFAEGKILLHRLASLGEKVGEGEEGGLHVEFVVDGNPTAEDVARVTKAFRQLAAKSNLDSETIARIHVGVVGAAPAVLSARLKELSSSHINVVAPASAVEFWAGLGMPLVVFTAKLLTDLTRVEVDIVYTGAAAQAAEALSRGQLKMENGQIRLKALLTPLEMIEEEKQKIQVFNQQA